MKLRRFVTFTSLLFALLILILPNNSHSKTDLVYVAPLENTVEKGLSQFLKRAVTTAERDNADVLIFEINTPGGLVDAAGEITKLLANSEVKTIAFINNDALSAGAYISLYADEIYMTANGSMGAAAIIDQEGNTAGEKADSMWFKEMRMAAEHSGRDPIYAVAMADKDVDLPEYGAEKGKLLTLTAQEAVEVGYAEGIVKNIDELITKLNYDNAEIVNINETFADKLARFVTHPLMVSILLSIGSLGLVLELYSPGFGVPGFMGISALLLFFYGHLIAGFAGYETILLFILGICLIIAEFIMAGGIFGILGIAAIITSVFLAAENILGMLVSVAIAIAIAVLGSIIMFKFFGKKVKAFGKIILTDATDTESGYVSNRNRYELVGLNAQTLTDLRPAGTVILDDERVDVVSEGHFIPKDVAVKVVKVEGSRIVVREIK